VLCRRSAGQQKIISSDQVRWVATGASTPRVERRSSGSSVPVAAAASITFSVAAVTTA
jgi:hypothetical protein